MRSLRDADRASSRGSLLLVVWLVEREARPAVVVVVVIVVTEVEEEGGTDGGNSGCKEPDERMGTGKTGVDKEGPRGL